MPKGRRGYYKQPSSIWREGWPIEVVGTLCNLQAYLQERWARDGIPDEEAGRAWISIGNLQSVTGTRGPSTALRRVAECCEYVSMCVPGRCAATTATQPGACRHTTESTPRARHRRTRRGTEACVGIEVDWPKFANYQHSLGEFARDSGAKEGLRVPRPASRVQPIEEPPKPPLQGGAGEEETPKAPPERRKRRGELPAPEIEPRPATAEELDELRSWCRAQQDPGLRQQEPRVAYLVERCTDWHRALPDAAKRCSGDWPARWRSWIARDLEKLREHGKTPESVAPPAKRWNEMTVEEQRASAAELTALSAQRAARTGR